MASYSLTHFYETIVIANKRPSICADKLIANLSAHIDGLIFRELYATKNVVYNYQKLSSSTFKAILPLTLAEIRIAPGTKSSPVTETELRAPCSATPS